MSVERREFDVTSVMQPVCSKLDSSTEGWQMLKIVLNAYSFMKKEAQYGKAKVLTVHKIGRCWLERHVGSAT
jgi:hypothetical protein